MTIDLKDKPRCARYLEAMKVKPNEPGMNDYWAALCIAESFSEKSLKAFGGITFHTMNGGHLLSRMERFLEFHFGEKKKAPAKKVKKSPVDGISGAVSNADIEAAKTAAGGWKRKTLEDWGVPWPPPKGWRQKLLDNHAKQSQPLIENALQS
jgi:hypothetical protein